MHCTRGHVSFRRGVSGRVLIAATPTTGCRDYCEAKSLGVPEGRNCPGPGSLTTTGRLPEAGDPGQTHVE